MSRRFSLVGDAAGQAHGLEVVRDADDRLRMAEKQQAARSQHAGEVGQRPAQRALGEIDEDVAAEQHVVERAAAVARRLEDVAEGEPDVLAVAVAEAETITAAGEEIPLPSKTTREVAPGSRIILQTAGAGGYGNPYKRDPQQVRQDVIEGFISIERAKEAYGVVLNPKTYEVDDAATRAERKQKAGTDLQ